MNEHYTFRTSPQQQTALIANGLLGIVRRRYGLMLGIILGVIVVSVGALRVLPSRYEASAILWLKPAFLVGQQDAALEAKLSERQQSIVQELRSTALAVRVVRSMQLHRAPEYEAALPDRPQGWQRFLARIIGAKAAATVSGFIAPQALNVDLSTEERESVRDLALATFFLKNFAVTVEGTERLRLTYRSDNPRFSYDVLQATLREFNESQVVSKAERLAQATTLLKQRIDFLRKRIDEPSRALLQADNVKLVELQNETDLVKPDAIISVPPTVPTRPLTPPLRLVFALSLFGGLVIALAVVAFLELRRWVRLADQNEHVRAHGHLS